MKKAARFMTVPFGFVGLALCTSGCSGNEDGAPANPGGAPGASGSGPAPSGGAGSSAGGSGGSSGASAGGAAGTTAGSGGAAGTTAGSGGAASGSGGVSGSAGTAGAAGAPTCAGGMTACGTACVNLTSDDAHCGACNAPCSGGRTCVASSCQCPSGSCAALPAFPGADGAAGTITGGRGGDVYHVTLLDTDVSDVRPGTLRYGLTGVTGPRTIVFDVSGVFRLGRTAVAGWDSNGNGWDAASRLNLPANVTLAGQTAPGPVILVGGSLRPGATNIIVRNVTVAPGYGNRSFSEPELVPVAGDFPDSYVFDAFDISGQNVMLDHVTTVYATDETISMNELANNVTIQYSNISQGQNYPQADAEASGVTYTGHALGSLLQAGSNAKVSVLHNLYAHQKGRLPRVGTEAGMLTVAGVGAYNDFRNNVFYNWLGTAGTGAAGQPSQNNFVNNFYLAGPGGDNPTGGASTAVSNAAGGTAIFGGSDATLTKVFHAGNLKDVNKDADAADGVALANGDFGSSAFQASAFTQTPYLGVTSTAAAALEHVLQYVGSTWWSRGPVDRRLVAEVRAVNGKILAWADNPFDASATEGTEWRALVATPMTSRPPGFDSDGDGMPNAWETAHTLNPNTADNNGDADMDGYTNLEEYLNEVAAWPAVAALIFNGEQSRRYAEIQNWNVGSAPTNTGSRKTAYWQPSRHDLALVRTGVAVVDAVGQHAGALRITGSNAGLDVVSGWLDVAGTLSIGGRVHLSGGALRAERLEKTARGAVFAFEGGTLSAADVRFDLVNRGGTLAPGRGVGTTRVSGDVVLERGALAIELAGDSNDGVHASGKLRLGGELRVTTPGGFTPRPGASWTIAAAERGISGRFESVPAGYQIEIRGNRVVLRFGELLESVAVSDAGAVCREPT